MVEPSNDSPAPAAQGTLAKTPFPHLLIYAHDRALSGTIELEAPNGEAATILVIDGQPLKARTSQPVVYLGHVLLELGFIHDGQLNESLRTLGETKRLHGQILKDAGAINDDQLTEGLRVQLLRKLRHMVSFPGETTFAYFDGYDGLYQYGGDDQSPIDPYPIIWSGIRELPPWDHVHAALTKVGTAGLRVSAEAELKRFAVDPAEKVVIDLLRARPQRLHELTANGRLSPRVTQLLVYTLLITKQLELVRESQLPPPVEPEFAPEPPSSKRSLQRASSPTDPPLSPSQAAVARVTLEAKARKKNVAVEERAPFLKHDDRLTPPPQRSPNPLGLSTPGEFIPPQPARSTTQSSRMSPAVQASAPPAVPPAAPATAMPPVAPLGRTTVPSLGQIAAAAVAEARPSSPGHSPGDIPARKTQPPKAGEALPPELAARKKEILDRASVIDKQNYFEMLDVPRDATSEQVQTAFFALAKVWHPDRLSGALVDVKDPCSRVFSHMSEAHQTLMDQNRRGRYMTLLRDGGATPQAQAEIVAVVEAATNFQKAEICLKRNDLPQAEELCKKAIKGDPEQADYHALLAWLDSMKPDKQSPLDSEHQIARLTKALAMNAKCERAYFYRGLLHKKLHQDAAAVKDFRKASELNPRNIDAQREVRLSDMRKGTSTPPAPTVKKGKEDAGKSSSLFGKLFKK